jgi:hypothetical protein
MRLEGKLVGLRAGVGRDDPSQPPSPQFTFSSRPSKSGRERCLELRPLNARAGSSPSAIAALSGPSLNSLLTSINALLGQLLNRLEIIWNYEFLQTLRNLPSDILLTVFVLILNIQILFGLLPPGTTLF